MNINGDPGDPEPNDVYEIGPLTYRQGFISVWKERHGQREEALMHDRAVVAVYTGTPERPAERAQLFRAWVDANELPSVLAHWANILR
ncbi:hypothetical protein [Streptomyces avidinii]|uniref:MmyB-like transcription regulator ligand binding domain-containing protein n=1 Tax=Streptomyces avidinii TaxID=1895 RepID=A0ABS4KWL2_STRAV|nr:hypothetical protein [Streptomyces avidinii]MBP2034428.1 hypothetical protein [Streptomyces avidinii]GGY86210.1 hypothetical protein GCM10010343_08910 [Streptomyces avidinii]